VVPTLTVRTLPDVPAAVAVMPARSIRSPAVKPVSSLMEAGFSRISVAPDPLKLTLWVVLRAAPSSSAAPLAICKDPVPETAPVSARVPEPAMMLPVLVIPTAMVSRPVGPVWLMVPALVMVAVPVAAMPLSAPVSVKVLPVPIASVAVPALLAVPRRRCPASRIEPLSVQVSLLASTRPVAVPSSAMVAVVAAWVAKAPLSSSTLPLVLVAPMVPPRVAPPMSSSVPPVAVIVPVLLTVTKTVSVKVPTVEIVPALFNAPEPKL
jgi:hypothetical protein